MEDFLVNGYAKKSTEKPPDRWTWYILHHGVCHSDNPEKLKVAFDGSADFKGT